MGSAFPERRPAQEKLCIRFHFCQLLFLSSHKATRQRVSSGDRHRTSTEDGTRSCGAVAATGDRTMGELVQAGPLLTTASTPQASATTGRTVLEDNDVFGTNAHRIDASLTPTALPPRDADIRDVDSHESKTGFVQTYYVQFAFAFM